MRDVRELEVHTREARERVGVLAGRGDLSPDAIRGLDHAEHAQCGVVVEIGNAVERLAPLGQ